MCEVEISQIFRDGDNPMSTVPANPLKTADDPPLSQIARMYEAYFTMLERQAVRLENVASELGDEEQREFSLTSRASPTQPISRR